MYLQDRINTQVIYRLALAQVERTSSILLNNCKQNCTSLSLLVGTTVEVFSSEKSRKTLFVVLFEMRIITYGSAHEISVLDLLGLHRF